MGTEAPKSKPSSTVILLEDERKKRLRNLLNREAKATGRLVLLGYNRQWNPGRKFKLNATAAGLFWRLFQSRNAGLHTAHVSVFELRALAASGILVIEDGERLCLGGGVVGYEVIEGEIPTSVLKHRNR